MHFVTVQEIVSGSNSFKHQTITRK